MPKLSVLIPSRNEQFLAKTVDDLFRKAADPANLEVVVVLEAYWPHAVGHDSPKENPNLITIHHPVALGMRAAINAAERVCSGDVVMKSDAHCMYSEGFDQKVLEDCKPDYVVIPLRKRLDAENWCIQDVGKPDIAYMYVSFPNDPGDWGGPGLNGKNWEEKNSDPALRDILIDDQLSFQGSCWAMRREYFHKLELMDEERYSKFWCEAQEIGFKAWLSGGRVIVSKRWWQSHLHKGTRYGRGYMLDKRWLNIGASYTKRWMFDDAWDKQTLPFEWLIEKFWPIPSWPETWREDIKQYNLQAKEIVR